MRERDGGVLLAHPGTQHSFRLAQQLHRHGLLGEFWTGLALHAAGPLGRLVRHRPRWRWSRALAGRLIEGIPRSKLRTRPLLELRALRADGKRSLGDEVFYERNRRFQTSLPARSLRRALAVVGFDTAAWHLVERARAGGKPLVLDQTAPPQRAWASLRREVAERFPGWVPVPRAPAPFEVVERREHEGACRIVVASSFVRDLLAAQGVPRERVAVIPYGADFAEGPLGGDRTPPGEVRFLFAGSVTWYKGAPVLLEAWRLLRAREARLRMVGSVPDAARPLIPELPGLEVLPRVPRARMPELYASHQVLVLPSLGEGFGLVVLEAMAQGLPVILSDATGAADVVEDGVEGLVVPAGDPGRLREAMASFVGRPERIRRMGEAARRKARTFTWERYGDRWADLLRDVLCSSS